VGPGVVFAAGGGVGVGPPAGAAAGPPGPGAVGPVAPPGTRTPPAPPDGTPDPTADGDVPADEDGLGWASGDARVTSLGDDATGTLNVVGGANTSATMARIATGIRPSAIPAMAACFVIGPHRGVEPPTHPTAGPERALQRYVESPASVQRPGSAA
jgi:hypothetical protein